MDIKLKLLFKVIVVVYGICFLRLFYLQIIKGNYYFKLSEENRIHVIVEPALRGNIFDANGKLLATSKKIFSAFYVPFISQKKIDSELISKIGFATLNKIEHGQLHKMIRLKSNIPREKAFNLLEKRLLTPYLHIAVENTRYYPFGENLSSVVGYIGEIDKDELEKYKEQGYKMGDFIGKLNIELAYEKFLKGEDGAWLVESDVHGKHLKLLKYLPPQRGNDVYLTIDSDLQISIEKCLAGKSGSVIVLEAKTGRVKALVSTPLFNPNYFVSKEENIHLKYLTDPNLPLFNRVISGLYPPGSVFKIITAISALEEGITDTKWGVYCPGYFKLGKKIFKCWEEKGHGWVSFYEGIRKSCDVYFYNLGLKVGVENLEKYAKKFMLSKLIGIDLPAVKKGFIPSEHWKKMAKKEPWYKGDTVNLSIGQGYITTTPLELAVMTSIIANKGVAYKPYIVEKIVNEKGRIIYKNEPKELTKVSLKPDIWEKIHKALLEVVESGTGRACFIEGMEIAGKTGTAENPHGEDHALFISFYPVHDPKIVVVVVIEHGGMGGRSAAPIAKNIYLEYKRIQCENKPSIN